jgi:RNA recognition motif-containing protein
VDRSIKMNIYVGNISRETSENEVRALFEEFGKVDNINLITDNFTKMLKGFGFIEMPNSEEGEKAIKNLNGQMFNGRPLTVNVAKPKTENSGNKNRRFR